MGVRIITYCDKEKNDNNTCNRGNNSCKEQLRSDDEWVDLGLPSGILWAKCNIGASKPEESGDYFAWGETKPKEIYDWTTYLYMDRDTNFLTKYGPDYNGSMLNDMDDVSVQVSGGFAHIPSVVNWQELIRHTYPETTTINGIKGVRLTASNGNCIFLPKAGFVDSDKIRDAGLDGNYWCAEILRSHPEYAYFHSLLEDNDCYDLRCKGLSVRAVCRITPSRFFQS